jgi:hypothetical protein
MAGDVELDYATFDEAAGALRQFLDPVLARKRGNKWDPVGWKWK